MARRSYNFLEKVLTDCARRCAGAPGPESVGRLRATVRYIPQVMLDQLAGEMDRLGVDAVNAVMVVWVHEMLLAKARWCCATAFTAALVAELVNYPDCVTALASARAEQERAELGVVAH